MCSARPRHAAHARGPVRIEVVTVENAKAALEQLGAGKAQLAVLRSDAALQGEAETVLIMRREAAVLIAPKAGKIQKIADLANGMLGITGDGRSMARCSGQCSSTTA